MRIAFALLLAASLAPGLAGAGEFTDEPVAAFPGRPVEQFLSVSVAPEMISPLQLQSRNLSGTRIDKPRKPRKGKPAKATPAAGETGMALGPERARILLRSLMIPGWGQASLDRRHAAAWFVALEGGVWTAFTAFRVQEKMRFESSMRTARLFAGIEMRGRDEEYQRIVGAYASSEEYNLLVVARDAANQFMQDPSNPDMVSYRAYIAAHSLGGADTWAWASERDFQRYNAQRRDAHRASMRANTAMALAIANRLASAVHAARAAGHTPNTKPQAWNFEVVPDPSGDPTAFRAGIRARF